MSRPDPHAVRAFLRDLQDRICKALEAADGDAWFQHNELEGERGGLARPRVLEGGQVIEKAAVNFSHAVASELPPAATERLPNLAGKPFQAVSVSLIVHPRNPHAPATHANFRAFFIGAEDAIESWWFGAGYDLTPFYGFEEDCRHWHATAREALAKHGDDLYPRFKSWCDEYFHLHHRDEARGIGGIFFDDYAEGGFDAAFAMLRDVADSFLTAYMPILERRKDTPYGERERAFQTYRRGRYVEFNLIYDRGTRYGIQAGSRMESVLASLPPLVSWRYDWQPDPGSPESRLYTDFLPVRDWLAE